MLGSNEGDRLNRLLLAKRSINREAGNITAESSIYETASWGKEDEPPFLNQALIIDTALEPQLLLDALLKIEEGMGRTRLGIKWGRRSIDIDILFYGNIVINKDNLQLPHPRISERMFTLLPLMELIPDFTDPVSGHTISRLKESCTDPLAVRKVDLQVLPASYE